MGTGDPTPCALSLGVLKYSNCGLGIGLDFGLKN